jgi:hypothetical protein
LSSQHSVLAFGPFGWLPVLLMCLSSSQVVRSLTPGITLAFSVWLQRNTATMEAIW